MKSRLLFPVVFLVFVCGAFKSTTTLKVSKTTKKVTSRAVIQDELFNEIDFGENKPGKVFFNKALKGYHKLKSDNKLDTSRHLLTMIDLSLSSNKKRLWTIDVNKKELIFNNLVAHGKNTGEEYAKSFSNTPHSLKSSLGFYVTAETYYGKHGLSLNLDGMEPGFNDNARKRRIVMHSADYVSKTFIKKYGRLGRSFGCPAVSNEIHDKMINTLKGGTCLFIYYPDKEYLKKSKLLN